MCVKCEVVRREVRVIVSLVHPVYLVSLVCRHLVSYKIMIAVNDSIAPFITELHCFLTLSLIPF